MLESGPLIEATRTLVTDDAVTMVAFGMALAWRWRMIVETE